MDVLNQRTHRHFGTGKRKSNANHKSLKYIHTYITCTIIGKVMENVILSVDWDDRDLDRIEMLFITVNGENNFSLNKLTFHSRSKRKHTMVHLH